MGRKASTSTKRENADARTNKRRNKENAGTRYNREARENENTAERRVIQANKCADTNEENKESKKGKQTNMKET